MGVSINKCIILAEIYNLSVVVQSICTWFREEAGKVKKPNRQMITFCPVYLYYLY